MKTKKQRISAAVAKRVGGKLSVDWAKVDLDQFCRGLEAELEHGRGTHKRTSPITTWS